MKKVSFEIDGTEQNHEPTRSTFFHLIGLMVSCTYYTILIYLGKIKPKHETKRIFLVASVSIGDKTFPRLLVLEDRKQISEEIQHMITVKADVPDGHFSIGINGAADSEGDPIPAGDFTIGTPVSDNDGAFQISNWDGTTRGGDYHVGSPNPDGTPNVANLSANVMDAEGKVVGIIGEQVAVVHGDVKTIDGAFSFDFGSATPSTGSGSGSSDVPATSEGSTESNG